MQCLKNDLKNISIMASGYEVLHNKKYDLLKVCDKDERKWESQHPEDSLGFSENKATTSVP